MNKNNGWIKVYRNSFNEELFKDRYCKKMAWIEIIQSATYEDKTVEILNRSINLKRGETTVSINRLSKRWQWHRNTVKKFLDELQNNKMIEYKTIDKVTTIIKIENYNDYQGINKKQNYQETKEKTNIANYDIDRAMALFNNEI